MAVPESSRPRCLHGKWFDTERFRASSRTVIKIGVLTSRWGWLLLIND